MNILLIFIIISLIILITLCFYNKEHFNVLKQHDVYTNYRKYIDDNYNYHTHHTHHKQLYQILDNCFVDHVNRCKGNKHLCQMYSLNKCRGPPRIT